MAAGGDAAAVKVGPGRLWVAPLGTAEPTDNSTALPSAWSPVGYTEEGNAYAADLTSEPVEVAEEIDPIRYENTRRLSRVTFSMAEATARNLVLALGGGTAQPNDDTDFELPAAGTEVAVMLVWDSNETADATNVRWLYRQAKPSGTIEIARRKSPQKSLIPVTFNLEKPTSTGPTHVFPNEDGDIA
jgi:hypothetical protein